MMRARLCGLAVVLSVTAGACGHSTTATDPTAAPTTTAPATTVGSATSAPSTVAAPTTTPDPCAGVTLTDSEIGVTKDSITVVVMADVGSELAPGLFQGNIDGVEAWARTVNANGGLACRKVVVEKWDSKLSATESTNGFLKACSDALAMVGSNALFVGDPAAVTNCADKAGKPTGFPDIPGLAVDSHHQCLTNVFPLGGVAGSCPYSGSGKRTFQAGVGAFKKVQQLAGTPLHGLWLIPADLPSTIASSMPIVRAGNAIGIGSDGEKGVSGRDPQAKFGAYVQLMKTAGSNFAYDSSNDAAFIKMRTEAQAQGLNDAKINWVCSLSCYTDAFRKDPSSEGTYVSVAFVPFEERAVNAEADTFLTAIGQPFPQSWAVGAWEAGRAFEQAVNAVVAADGANGLTRAKVIAAMKSITTFDDHAFAASIDFSKKGITPCFALLQLRHGNFVRVWPTEPGKLDCDPGNLATWTGDSTTEYKG
jgi:hypothetical protein